MKKTGSNAPQKPTRSPMPKCRPPKGELEIPKFMEKFQPKDTITFYGWDGSKFEFEVHDEDNE